MHVLLCGDVLTLIKATYLGERQYGDLVDRDHVGCTFDQLRVKHGNLAEHVVLFVLGVELVHILFDVVSLIVLPVGSR